MRGTPSPKRIRRTFLPTSGTDTQNVFLCRYVSAFADECATWVILPGAVLESRAGQRERDDLPRLILATAATAEARSSPRARWPAARRGVGTPRRGPPRSGDQADEADRAPLAGSGTRPRILDEVVEIDDPIVVAWWRLRDATKLLGTGRATGSCDSELRPLSKPADPSAELAAPIIGGGGESPGSPGSGVADQFGLAPAGEIGRD
jgi:hypothetical protein